MVECFVVVEGSSAFVCCTLAILHILEEQSGCIRISTFDFLDVRRLQSKRWRRQCLAPVVGGKGLWCANYSGCHYHV